jgi:hypothetical protein
MSRSDLCEASNEENVTSGVSRRLAFAPRGVSLQDFFAPFR